MGDEEEGVDLADLAAKIEQLERAVDRLRKPYAQLVGYLDRLQAIARSYFRLLGLLDRYGALSPDMAIPGLKDPISRDIVRILFERGDRNITQVTEALRARRGSASRRIVRERLRDLEEDGILLSERTSRGRTYAVSEETVRRWSQILGLAIPEEESGTP